MCFLGGSSEASKGRFTQPAKKKTSNFLAQNKTTNTSNTSNLCYIFKKCLKKTHVPFQLQTHFTLGSSWSLNSTACRGIFGQFGSQQGLSPPQRLMMSSRAVLMDISERVLKFKRVSLIYYRDILTSKDCTLICTYLNMCIYIYIYLHLYRLKID